MNYYRILLIVVLGLISVPQLSSQVNPLKKIKERTDQKINRGIDKSLDKVFDKKDKDQQTDTDKDVQAPPAENNTPPAAGVESTGNPSTPELKWSKYDFVPGDRIIFEDNLEGEENGEFPSRWDFVRGNVEVAEFGGENVIMFRDGHPSIIPYMENPASDYLPEVFTVEMDLYCAPNNFEIFLYDTKNQKSGSPTGYTELKTNYYRMEFSSAMSELPDRSGLEERRWIHIAIAYTRGKLKAYLDETRLINLPRIDFDPKGITLYTYHASNNNPFFVKNVRIAEGGVKYYDRVMEDGKIVANGIRFDSGKASLKPESMGILNEIYSMLQEHPDLNLSIEGHTDNTGSAESNLELSEKRAETVLKTLTGMGIDPSRLSSRGYGETIPVSDNKSPEGRAENRRVEFVKTN